MRIQEFLEEDNGALSSTRLALMLWVVGVLAAWIVVSLQTRTLAPLDSSVSAILGILMTGKVVQKFGEKPPAGALPPGAAGSTELTVAKTVISQP